jgi:hypothetical protein
MTPEGIPRGTQYKLCVREPDDNRLGAPWNVIFTSEPCRLYGEKLVESFNCSTESQ